MGSYRFWRFCSPQLAHVFLAVAARRQNEASGAFFSRFLNSNAWIIVSAGFVPLLVQRVCACPLAGLVLCHAPPVNDGFMKVALVLELILFDIPCQ